MLPESFTEQLAQIVGAENVVTSEKERRSGSKDCYWFSPVLTPILDDKYADVIVRPASEDEVVSVVALCVKEGVPITPRGAGTGNYGQGVPMQGGVLLHFKRMNQISSLCADKVCAQAGTVLQKIEDAAGEAGAELRFFPSTMPTATLGGFVAGGSGGIGSVQWGMLFDEGNVLHARMVTIEEVPRVLDLTEPKDLSDVIHNCGLTGILTEITMALAPAQRWQQYVVAFNSLDEALRAGERFAYDDSLMKRLVTVFEAPIPQYFVPLVKQGACPDGKAVLFLYLTEERSWLESEVAGLGGTVTLHIPPHEGKGRGQQLYDYTWNHTTLWAIKADESLTYLQDRFDRAQLYEQIKARKEKFGDQLFMHVEFSRVGGVTGPGGLSIVRYEGREQLWEIIRYCQSIGVQVANPHTHYLDEDSRWYRSRLMTAKDRWDPKGLLNPGHVLALETASG